MIGDRVGGAPFASLGGPPRGIGPFHTQSLGVSLLVEKTVERVGRYAARVP